MNNSIFDSVLELSASFKSSHGRTPFGAILTVDGEILGKGVSSVVGDCDPTAHAEINAIRQACRSLGTHQLRKAQMYCSAFPCPLCLMACKWAGITTIYYCASLDDSRKAGFEDSAYYDSLELGPDNLGITLIPSDSELKRTATTILNDWKRMFDSGNWK